MLEKYRIKRVPIVWDDKLVGIISRADLFHGLVARQVDMPPSIDDREIKKNDRELAEAGVMAQRVNIVVSGEIVHVWGHGHNTR